MKNDPNASRENGKQFEELFLKQAQLNGLLAQKNPLSAKWTYGGRLQLIKGQLDYILTNQQGRTGFFDCKSYAGEYFVYSEIDRKQLERAILWNDWGVPSGFVVWLRGAKSICFYSGHAIAAGGPETRFTREGGQFLGAPERFDLKPLIA